MWVKKILVFSPEPRANAETPGPLLSLPYPRPPRVCPALTTTQVSPRPQLEAVEEAESEEG